MQCMEVWGGNQQVDSGVVMAGLDAWVYSEPFQGEIGGGDVHYVSSCATGRIVRLLVADVAGHGAGVAEIAVALRKLMRRYVNHVDQGRFLRAINGEFPGITSGGRFATAAAATYWAPTGDLIICNAGHPPPLWYRSKLKRWQYIDRDMPAGVGELANVPLGLLDLTRYDQWRIRLAQDDVVVFYTDSFLEVRSPEGRQLGLDGLLSMATQIDLGDPSQFVPSILRLMKSFRGDVFWEDDVTVLVIKPNGSAPRLTLGERLRSNVRMAKALISSMRPGGEAMPWPELSFYNVFGAMTPGVNQKFGSRDLQADQEQPRAD